MPRPVTRSQRRGASRNPAIPSLDGTNHLDSLPEHLLQRIIYLAALHKDPHWGQYSIFRPEQTSSVCRSFYKVWDNLLDYVRLAPHVGLSPGYPQPFTAEWRRVLDNGVHNGRYVRVYEFRLICRDWPAHIRLMFQNVPELAGVALERFRFGGSPGMPVFQFESQAAYERWSRCSEANAYDNYYHFPGEAPPS